MIEQRTEVFATVRNPDGQPAAVIDGLVIRQLAANGGSIILDKPTAIRWAMKRLLWCHAPNGRDAVEIEAVDRDGDGVPDYLQTKPDHTRENNLTASPSRGRCRTGAALRTRSSSTPTSRPGRRRRGTAARARAVAEHPAAAGPRPHRRLRPPNSRRVASTR